MSNIYCYKMSTSEDSYTDGTVAVSCSDFLGYGKIGDFKCEVIFLNKKYIYKCRREHIMLKKFLLVLSIDDVTEEALESIGFKEVGDD